MLYLLIRKQFMGYFHFWAVGQLTMISISFEFWIIQCENTSVDVMSTWYVFNFYLFAWMMYMLMMDILEVSLLC